MKRPFYLFAFMLVAACLAALSYSRGADSNLSPSKEDMLEREAVAKAFSAHRFTPPVPLTGPAGFTWYIGARSLTPQSLAQIVVGVHRGSHFTVEVTAFKRDREDAPWVATGKGTEPAIARFDQAMRDQLRKELALEERTR